MGVGFGRRADGQPQGTPDKNALLNIQSINDKPVGFQFCPGYIISAAKENGIYVGITKTNADRFKLDQTKLCQGPDHASDNRDWAAVPMTLSVNGSPYVAGTALIDTGVAYVSTTLRACLSPFTLCHIRAEWMISQMYLRAGITLPSVPSTLPGISRIVSNGTIVNVAIPDGVTPAILHTFRVGDFSDPWTPPYVIPEASSTQAYINTGRHLLVAFDAMFDAKFGYYGLRDVRTM